jgi:hypothetical protein
VIQIIGNTIQIQYRYSTFFGEEKNKMQDLKAPILDSVTCIELIKFKDTVKHYSWSSIEPSSVIVPNVIII